MREALLQSKIQNSRPRRTPTPREALFQFKSKIQNLSPLSPLRLQIQSLIFTS